MNTTMVSDAVFAHPSNARAIGVPTVFHVQQRAPVNGQLLFRQGCAVLEEQLQLEAFPFERDESENVSTTSTVYTPVECLGSAELILLRYWNVYKHRALYTMKRGDDLLIYTPYRKMQVTCFEKDPLLLPIYSSDLEAMFRVAAERAQPTPLFSPQVLETSGDCDATIKLSQVLHEGAGD